MNIKEFDQKFGENKNAIMNCIVESVKPNFIKSAVKAKLDIIENEIGYYKEMGYIWTVNGHDHVSWSTAESYHSLNPTEEEQKKYDEYCNVCNHCQGLLYSRNQLTSVLLDTDWDSEKYNLKLILLDADGDLINDSYKSVETETEAESEFKLFCEDCMHGETAEMYLYDKNGVLVVKHKYKEEIRVMKESYYSGKYKMIKDVTDSQCYTGGKSCNTCMYCLNHNPGTGVSFNNSYCLMNKKAVTD